MTRISDVGDPGAISDSCTNGYSRWSPESLTGIEELVHDFTDEYPTAAEVQNGVEGAPSVDMSPSGSRIVVGSCKEDAGTPPPWNGPYAWSLDFGSNVRLGTNCTHYGRIYP